MITNLIPTMFTSLYKSYQEYAAAKKGEPQKNKLHELTMETCKTAAVAGGCFVAYKYFNVQEPFFWAGILLASSGSYRGRTCLGLHFLLKGLHGVQTKGLQCDTIGNFAKQVIPIVFSYLATTVALGKINQKWIGI